MNLAFEVVGKGDPLIILHGLLGSADNWRSMSRRLGAHYKVFAVDLRNHGRSPHSDVFNYDVMAVDLREFMEHQALRRIVLLGHSMGGKVAMKFAIEYSDQVDRLVIVDIAPKPYQPAKRYMLEALRSLDLTRYKFFADVDAALAAEVPGESLRQFLLKNLARDENGRLRWKVYLEVVYRNYDKLARGLAVERTFDKPTLFIRGGKSNYIEDDDATLIRQIFPQADIATLPEAGHWVHVNAPEEFLQTVLNFLNRS
ncbi:MAG TPA: alpha/beta fold hydrolase [Candidatus Binatia bacterium]|nr:alpha/beta fold hydrolase [Candidatus Binatia bacterium]